ncbi:MAG: hypothetical protein QOF83_591 [Solirubrobacteraceae bacterium]|jgi:NAD(P)-dependent dehydrogenase (short-subunit alcohol dehydrogenase family)|nr:hypothetical protein [Solirubrobacteraceae bacterium]
MDLGLSGKVALVTGGSRGIGLAVARALATEGARVALLARDPDTLAAAAAGLRGAIGVSADAADPEAIRVAVARVEDELGPVEILVTAAATPNSSTGFGEDELLAQVDVKVAGALRCVRAVAPGMASRGWGRIICISGLAARQTGSVVGSVRNVAVAAMVKNLADELGPQGVNVTCVHPGMTITEKTPALMNRLAERQRVTPDEIEARFGERVAIGRMATAGEVADVITFLASPRSVAINGDTIAAGGGARGSIHY